MKNCENIKETMTMQEQEIIHFTFNTTQHNLVYLFNDFEKGALKYDKLKNNEYTFVIYDFNKKHKWSPVYECLFNNSYLCKKKPQYILEIDDWIPMYLTLESQNLTLDDDDYDFLIFLPTFKNWVKYQNKNKVPQNNSLELREFLNSHYTKKMVNSGYIPDKKLQPTIACVICKDKIVGFAASIYNKSFDYSISGNNIHDYISRVDIIEEYQHQGLCSPLLTYLLDYLVFVKNIKSIYIDNLSDTVSDSHNGKKKTSKAGVPACFCYLRSGFHNDFEVYLDSQNGITLLHEDFCNDDKEHNNEAYIYKR